MLFELVASMIIHVLWLLSLNPYSKALSQFRAINVTFVTWRLCRHFSFNVFKTELVISPFPLIIPTPQNGGGGNDDIECLCASIILSASRGLVHLILGEGIIIISILCMRKLKYRKVK